MTSTFATAFNSALLHFLWQGCAAAALLFIALYALRRRSAASRYAACCATLLAMAAMPVVTAMVLSRAPADSPQPLNAVASTEVTVEKLSPPATSTVVARAARAVLAMPAEVSLQVMSAVRRWALPLWSIGVLLFALRFAWGCRQATVFRNSGSAASDEIAATVVRLAARMKIFRPVAALTSVAAASPSVVGWWRPAILLPAATLAGLTPEQLEAVLAHELAHIRRHDYAVNLLQGVVETLLFYHPAVWWVSRRIREERELCCDDLAIACGHDAVCYARALTELEKMRATSISFGPAIAITGQGGPLMYRIQRLLGVTTPQYGPSRLGGAIALLAALAGVSLSLAWAKRPAVPSTLEAAQPSSSAVITPKPTPIRDARAAAASQNQTSATPSQPVTVEVTIDPSGEVTDARVVSGPMEFRKPALHAALERHFDAGPAMRTQQVAIDPAKDLEANPEGEMQRLQRSLEELEQKRDQLISSQEEQRSALEQQMGQLQQRLGQLEQGNSALGWQEGALLGPVERQKIAQELKALIDQKQQLQISDLLSSKITEQFADIIQPGDHLTLKVPKHPELSKEVEVDDHCQVTLPVIQKIEVCGNTLRQVHDRLREEFARHFPVQEIQLGLRRPPGTKHLEYWSVPRP